MLGYTFVEKAQGFRCRSRRTRSPTAPRVILFLDDKGNVFKAVPDSVWNRKAVLDALAAKDEPGK